MGIIQTLAGKTTSIKYSPTAFATVHMMTDTVIPQEKAKKMRKKIF
jgi:hypothetical protein